MDSIKRVKVDNGYVEGKIINVLGRDIVQFLSIPYCKAPIGKLRFQKPQPCESFSNEVINNLQFVTFPPQPVFHELVEQNSIFSKWIPKGVIDEDSLYVNIWCPLQILTGTEKQAVFIFIYGGGFNSGSSSIEAYDGSVLSSQENIIYVSFNYRIGMLGFLCLDDHIQGNFGIWDQVCALKWIYENITVFNGDRENVTLAGCSAGGCSASLHMLIEESWPYFSKVIIESGVCLSNWAIIPKTELVRRSIICVNKLLEKHNFPVRWHWNLSNEEKITVIGFLENIDFKEFLTDFKLFKSPFQLPWVPTVDGELVKHPPIALFYQGQFKKCPMIVCNVENEGDLEILLNHPDIAVDDDNMISLKYFYESLEYYPYIPIVCDDSIKDRIKREYNILGDNFSINTFEKILTDKNFVCDSLELANVVSRFHDQVYYFWFNTLSPNSIWPKWCGIMHGAEVFHLFGTNLREDSNSTDSEKETTKLLMRQFTDFARNGCLSNEVPLYKETTKRYMSLELNGWISKVFSDDQINKFNFWMNLKYNK